MKVSYDNILAEALDAIRAGEAADTVAAGHPALRDDLAVAACMCAIAGRVAVPGEAATDAAWIALRDELRTQRVSGAQLAVSRSRWGVRRFAFAGVAAIAIAVAAAGVFLTGGSDPASAAVIEGVVVENAGGKLTIQTAGALEEVEVPAGAPVSDAAGATIALDQVAPGQVVTLTLDEESKEPVAAKVERQAQTAQEWCRGAPERCRSLAVLCEERPAACAALTPSPAATRPARPAPTPTVLPARPVRPTPTATPAPVREVRPTATGTPVRPTLTPTPVRTGEADGAVRPSPTPTAAIVTDSREPIPSREPLGP